MGSRIDGFDIDLEFDDLGRVSTIKYTDGAGCGHSALFSDPSTKLSDVVGYHLSHYKNSHKMEPPKKCAFSAVGYEGDTEVTFDCMSEPHPDYPLSHVLKLRQVRD